MEQKPKVDPGWNDPPMLNYSPSNPPPKSRIINKRVAFPLSSSNNTTKSQPIFSETPPQNLPNGASLLPTISIMESQGNSSFRDTKEKLICFLTTTEAKQRFSKVWEEEKVPNDCEKAVNILVKSLVENDKATARIIKAELMSEHKQLCEQWLDSIDV